MKEYQEESSINKKLYKDNDSLEEDNSEEKKSIEEPDNQISLLEKYQKYLDYIQEKTGIKGTFVIWGIILILLLLYFHIFEDIITNLVGTIYPSFWTIKALEQNSNDELKKWLIYWVVFSTFIFFDRGFPIIVKFIPFYFFFKLLFLMILIMPGSTLCSTVYYLVVKRFYGYYEEKIDSYVSGVKEYSKDMFHENNLKNFKNINKTSGKKFASLDNKNMKEDYEENDKKHKY